MKKILVIICFILIYSCGNSTSEEKEPTEIVETESGPTDLDRLKLESSRLRGGGFIKNVDFENGKATIHYVKNYKEYKELNPQSGLKKENFDDYWSTEEVIEKALVDGSVRLMKKLDFVDHVEIILPNQGKEYSIRIKKTELEQFIGLDFQTIIANWDEEFTEPFVYNDQGRKKFFSQFVKKK